MELHQIKAFIDAMASSDLTELEVSKDGWTLKLVRGGGRGMAPRPVQRAAQPQARPPADVSATATAASGTEIQAPLSGIAYLGPSPDAPPLVVPGQAVKAGTTVCIIEAMKTFSEVTCDRDGVVEAVFVTSGAEVEAGQPLMRIV